MRWDRSHRSDYVEDRRGEAGPGVSPAGLGLLLPLVGRFGWKGLVVAGAIFLIVRGVGTCADGGGTAPRGRMAASYAPGRSGAEEELARFVGFVFDDVQASWQRQFATVGDRYEPAHLVLFTDAVSTGCGDAPAEVGPFYCPRDQRVYIDLSFYRELRQRFGAQGDFAQAYVIAHELGHHVEQLRHVHAPESTKDSVGYELLADCLAGTWAKDAQGRGLLEGGDLEEALGAAAAVGDDRIQQQATGSVHPETWTHGSSKDRQQAFQHGFVNGGRESCGLMPQDRR